MRDHMKQPSNRSTRTVGVRELKTHAARIVRQVRDSRVSYTLTHRGRAIGVILPLDSDSSRISEDADAAVAWTAFLRAGRRLERRFRPGVSGLQILHTSRR